MSNTAKTRSRKGGPSKSKGASTKSNTAPLKSKSGPSKTIPGPPQPKGEPSTASARPACVVRVPNLPAAVRCNDLLNIFQFSFAHPLEAQLVPADDTGSSVGYVTFENDADALNVALYLGVGDGIGVVDAAPQK